MFLPNIFHENNIFNNILLVIINVAILFIIKSSLLMKLDNFFKQIFEL